MKYLYLTLIVCLHTTLTVTAQKMSFQSAVGTGYFSGYHHSALGFTYEPRFNFHQFSEKSALSLTGSWTMGPSINDDYRTQQPKYRELLSFPWMMDAVAAINYSYGNAATPKSYQHFGYTLGIGYGSHRAVRKTDPLPGQDSLYLQAHGLVLHALFNFPVGNSSWSLKPSYMFNFGRLNKDVKGIFGMSLLYNIGVHVNVPKEPPPFRHSKQYYKDLNQEARKRKWEQYQERRNKRKGIPADSTL
ncbi:hypothetical protein [Chitinophaga arvensicola]|uniref:Outer membrane protein beta-barrel domain-containing protein n=1 Tax=Chitinophaga arvensicola TaxID=29529 RepID=A0A1I0QUE2_9BACT|nr:hypothetical protein [Chitinophaga arvensicola]SEW31206.1 hypothetical protein SAMN04488122_1762 [Chitinophaga arvensicola]